MSIYLVHHAHTGEVQHVTAADWRAALRSTGRTDACLVERADASTLDVTFDAENPTTISCRLRDRQSDAAAHTQLALNRAARELRC